MPGSSWEQQGLKGEEEVLSLPFYFILPLFACPFLSFHFFVFYFHFVLNFWSFIVACLSFLVLVSFLFITFFFKCPSFLFLSVA